MRVPVTIVTLVKFKKKINNFRTFDHVSQLKIDIYIRFTTNVQSNIPLRGCKSEVH